LSMASQVFRRTLSIATRGHSFESVTAAVAAVVAASSVREGLCNVFIRHTSASVLITENADPAVHRDLERFMQRIVPEGADYEHDAEGPDDMPAHLRSMLTAATLTIPVSAGELLLGAWQGIYLWEHRSRRHPREVLVTVLGES
jgi:secondary thiamine-phosphate synthase enzyme